MLGFLESGQKKLKVLEIGDTFCVNQMIKNEGSNKSFGIKTD